ncbi:hypothetical protein [Fictibacillus barbaricus]|uniref:Uncharacterized protein n=1 Tax=Fictibacillus barbaricus TaxID=182136 RepID=A0ABS2ZBS1_9BACL|nr:hypothetical protein [Fictibacillus barbaricus]MBN3544190.1 hypothetical protein [Fictibacillus barbaricus]GGB69648.1 hypothetical protein GCM10007199_39840 [Fictibacillus barbaricus]
MRILQKYRHLIGSKWEPDTGSESEIIQFETDDQNLFKVKETDPEVNPTLPYQIIV